jgi:hypothetical protein
MSSESKIVKYIFLAAAEKPSPAERAAFLDEACANDAALRQRVEALLRAQDDPESFLEKPAIDMARPIEPVTIPGKMGEAEDAGPQMIARGSTGP